MSVIITSDTRMLQSQDITMFATRALLVPGDSPLRRPTHPSQPLPGNILGSQVVSRQNPGALTRCSGDKEGSVTSSLFTGPTRGG